MSRSLSRRPTGPVRLWRALAFAAGLPLALLACGESTPEERANGAPAAGGERAREVRTTAATEDRLVRRVAVTGTLAAEEQVTLSLKVTGRLDELLVDLGSRVRQGEVVARLMPTDFELRVGQATAALQQARARLGLPPDGEDDTVQVDRTAIVRQARAVLEEARLTRERSETFLERGIGSKADLDAAVASFEVADSRYQDALEEVRNRQALLEQRRTELDLARQALQDSLLTAPFDGMVRERHATIGQYLAAGSPVATIVRVHPLRLRLAIPERDAPLIRPGLDVRVMVEGDPRAHAGRIARVSPAIEEASRTLMVEATVPNPNGELRPGAFADAEVVTASQDTAVLVPTSALVTFAGVDKVLTVADGRIVEKPVRTGRREGERVEILDGVSAGESVVLEPGNLVQGDAVRVAAGAADEPAPAAR